MKQININDFIYKNSLNTTERLEVLGMEFIKIGDKYMGSKYALCVVASKRARQLIDII